MTADLASARFFMKTLTFERIPHDVNDRHLSVREIAALDGTSEATVRRQIREGLLKGTRVGKRKLGVKASVYRAARA
jgi:excisionase family DNA binding protein